MPLCGRIVEARHLFHFLATGRKGVCGFNPWNKKSMRCAKARSNFASLHSAIMGPPTNAPLARLFLHQIDSNKAHIMTTTPGKIKSLLLELAAGWGDDNDEEDEDFMFVVMIEAERRSRQRRRHLLLLWTLVAYLHGKSPGAGSAYLR